MLSAKAQYAFARNNVNARFVDFIKQNIEKMGDKAPEEFYIFCSLFEAVVAYSKGLLKD
jgi:CRISPR type III-A-associated protein Csm2